MTPAYATLSHALPSLRRAAAAMAALAALSLSANAYAADVDHGETLAKRWCAACHVVASDQSHGQDNAPPFATIAKIPGFDANAIARFLMNPHPKMPDMQISRDEADDLAAYIVRQGK
ncbi:MAG: c-type cytochrome [Roseiarcus sp.]|uniref:c-type cytochrome n=1 Tax=Roseiarcus sp. TaxID=1969460 RepID=UPI003C247BC6